MKFASIVGARPNFMKLAPLAHELARAPGTEHFVVHTGQHYDPAMSDAFFRDLDLPRPRYHLAVGSGSHAEQTAAVMARLEPVLQQESPDVVILYGDVNSTAAAALTAAKLNLPIAHVEAGLRSHDRTMPEEVNRVVTDALADLLFAPSLDAVANLRAEGHSAQQIHFAGNVMIDVLVRALAVARTQAADGGADPRPARAYAVATLHRPANVDDPATLRELLAALTELSRECEIVFPLHPRTRARLAALGTPLAHGPLSRVRPVEPLGYPQMVDLVAGARLVITDSGGLQEETTYLGVPCLTVRTSTERPITCTQGTNRLVAADRHALLGAARQALAAPRRKAPVIERWDGRAAERIAAVLCQRDRAIGGAAA